MNFPPRVQHKDVLLFYVVLMAFTFFGLLFLLFTQEHRLFALGITAFPALLLFLMWQQTAAKDMCYELREDGLFLKRFFMKRLVAYSEIDSIKKIDQKEAIELLNEKITEVYTNRAKDNRSAFKSHKDVNEITKFTSVPVVFITTRSFRRAKRTAAMKGEFIWLKLTNGQHYFLSPIDTDTFIQEVQRRMAKVIV